MGIKEIKTDLLNICEAFKLGVLSSWETKPNPVQNYQTAFFKVEGIDKIYQYHFLIKKL